MAAARLRRHHGRRRPTLARAAPPPGGRAGALCGRRRRAASGRARARAARPRGRRGRAGTERVSGAGRPSPCVGLPRGREARRPRSHPDGPPPPPVGRPAVSAGRRGRCARFGSGARKGGFPRTDETEYFGYDLPPPSPPGSAACALVAPCRGVGPAARDLGVAAAVGLARVGRQVRSPTPGMTSSPALRTAVSASAPSLTRELAARQPVAGRVRSRFSRQPEGRGDRLGATAEGPRAAGAGTAGAAPAVCPRPARSAGASATVAAWSDAGFPGSGDFPPAVAAPM
ncbi:transcription initiation factor TFIID subunit 4-like [Meles meles]|uniref:transcription initiation factor TFIID subunit 4-like n=1 Tax=Meles meles TaxID=9662 RepID=UPI001E6A0A03|nr:transcription initiation factor TFIID subunit 4-like [Meles meles]